MPNSTPWAFVLSFRVNTIFLWQSPFFLNSAEFWCITTLYINREIWVFFRFYEMWAYLTFLRIIRNCKHTSAKVMIMLSYSCCPHWCIVKYCWSFSSKLQHWARNYTCHTITSNYNAQRIRNRNKNVKTKRVFAKYITKLNWTAQFKKLYNSFKDESSRIYWQGRHNFWFLFHMKDRE